MHEIKDTQRALVRIGYDGRVHKTFRGHQAYARFSNEVRVLRYLESRGCTFVPRLIEVDEPGLKIVTTNCGSRVDQISPERLRELFAELETFGVRHDHNVYGSMLDAIPYVPGKPGILTARLERRN